MTANIDAMISAAVKAFRAGKKAEARALLEKATDLDQNNEQAWMWMSAVVDSTEDQRICLENVLYINPNNADAKRGLEILAAKSRSSGAAPTPAPDKPSPAQTDPFADASFATTPEPFSTQGSNDIIDSGIPTSSASATYNPANEPSTAQYDDWVAGLNLGKGSSAGEDDPYQLDDAAFAGAFADSFGFDGLSDDDDDVDLFAAKSSSGSGFDDSLASGPFKSDAFTLDSDISFGDEDDEDDDGFGIGYDAPPERSPSKPIMSPAFDTGDLPRIPPSKSGLDDLGVDTSEFYIGGEAALTEIDPSEYFREIPPKIKPTRLPGVDESYPVLVVLGLLVLILLNVGAAGFLLSNLAG